MSEHEPKEVLDLKQLVGFDMRILLYLIDLIVDLLEAKGVITPEDKVALVEETVRRWYGSTE